MGAKLPPAGGRVQYKGLAPHIHLYSINFPSRLTCSFF